MRSSLAINFAAPIAVSLTMSLACMSVRFGSDSFDANSHAEDLDIADAVSEVSIEVGSGGVDLTGASVSTVSVRSKIQGTKNHLRQDLQDGKLRLFVDCVEEPCRAVVNATLPSSVPLRARTGSGDIHARGLNGATRLETGSGDISASELTGAIVDAHSGSGDIELQVSKPTERLQARAGSGDVKLQVPAGSYRVDVDTGSGDRSVRGVSVDAAAPNWIAVKTGSGDVQIDAR